MKNHKIEVEQLVKAIEKSFKATDIKHKVHPEDDGNSSIESELEFCNGSADKKQNEYLNIETVVIQQEIMDKDYKFDEYVYADIHSVEKDFLKGDLQYIIDVLIHIVAIETPIHFDVLSRRIAPLFGKERAGAKIKTTYQ